MDKFEAFKLKEKFAEDKTMLYPGIADLKLLPVLTEKINQAADDFKEVALQESPTAAEYQEKIRIGLGRFQDVSLQLNTEDRERVCQYFEELMVIVGLQSSGGQLNKFMYGFDPEEVSKSEA